MSPSDERTLLLSKQIDRDASGFHVPNLHTSTDDGWGDEDEEEDADEGSTWLQAVSPLSCVWSRERERRGGRPAKRALRQGRHGHLAVPEARKGSQFTRGRVEKARLSLT
jgi:hypothetical protein